VVLQYWFDGSPVESKIKPHGISHTATPFFVLLNQPKKDIKKLQLPLSQQKLFSKLQKKAVEN